MVAQAPEQISPHAVNRSSILYDLPLSTTVTALLCFIRETFLNLLITLREILIHIVARLILSCSQNSRYLLSVESSPTRMLDHLFDQEIPIAGLFDQFAIRLTT